MASKEYPVVLRFEGMGPSDISGYEAHRYRKYGDLGHIDRNKPKPRRLIGSETWAQEALAEIKLMTIETFAAELTDLDRRNRRKDLQKRRIEGPREPWRTSRHGPMREVILTANKEWFEHTDNSDEEFNTAREKKFEDCAVTWLKKNFGDDVIHARADTDEEAYHIHAVIMPRATVRKHRVECQILQPSIHPLIKDYEAAQDSVGEWFSEIGLVRGEARKQAIRDALNNGKKPPAKRRHVRPATWRAQEEKRLAEKAASLETRECGVAAREEVADDVIAFASAVSCGEIDENGSALVPKASTVPPVHAPVRKATFGFVAARKAFRAATRRLRSQADATAKQKAQDHIADETAKIAEAKQRMAADAAEISRADETLVEIARLLPDNLRMKIANVRRKLTARIMAIDPGAKGRTRPSGPRQDDSS